AAVSLDRAHARELVVADHRHLPVVPVAERRVLAQRIAKDLEPTIGHSPAHQRVVRAVNAATIAVIRGGEAAWLERLRRGAGRGQQRGRSPKALAPVLGAKVGSLAGVRVLMLGTER